LFIAFCLVFTLLHTQERIQRIETDSVTDASILATNTIIRVSVNSVGEQGNSISWVPAISGNGRIVSFLSTASNLDVFAHRGIDELFTHDLLTGQTALAGKVPATGQPTGEISCPSALSADGRYLAFGSLYQEIIPGDDNAGSDIFRLDRLTGEVIGISLTPEGITGTGSSYQPSISADGRFVAFESSASDLVSGDGNGKWDIFVRDTETGQTELVSVTPSADLGSGDSRYPSISADGRFVAFSSVASDLVPGDINNQEDVFLRDRQTAQTTLISLTSGGVSANGNSGAPAISPDGNWVAYASWATNLASGDSDSNLDVYLYDRQSGETTLISTLPGDKPAGNSWFPSISGDGRFVAFNSSAPFTLNDDNADDDVYLFDRLNNQLELISHALDGTAGNGKSRTHSGSISNDGCSIAFDSYASDLVENDTNGYRDVFVYKRGAGCGSSNLTTIYFPHVYNNLLNRYPHQLAYTVEENFNTDIYLVNADGSGREPLLTGPDHERDPSWSPDGDRLAFSANYSGTFLIYILNMRTRQISGFALSATGLRLPRWSPDGSRIAYVESYGDYEELWVQTVETQEPPLRLLTVENRPDKGFLQSGIEDYAWSPDGNQIAVEVYGYEGEGVGTWCTPIVINRDGSNLRLLGNWKDTSYLLGCGNRSRSPTWSPDSQWIAFSQQDPAVTQYWLYNIFRTRQDGVILERITNIDPSSHTDYLEYLAWSPDGKYLVFSVDPGTIQVDNSLQLIDLTTKEITHLTDNDDLNWKPAWSPDGQQIAYRRILSDNSEIEVVDPFHGGIINLTNSPAYNNHFNWRPNPSTLPPSPEPRDTCTLAGIAQPTIRTDFQDGLEDFGARPVYTSTSQGGQVAFNHPGVRFTSNQTGRAVLAFESWAGGGTLAVRLQTDNIYQVGLVASQSVLDDGTWANATQNGGWMVGLHTDHNGVPNGNILYANDSGSIAVGEQFDLPTGDEVVVVFDMLQRRFKIYNQAGVLIIDTFLPPQWYSDDTPDWRWWVLGDAWSDSLHDVDLQVLDLCYSESP